MLSKRCHGDPGGLENSVFSGPPAVLTATPTRQDISINILILLFIMLWHIFICLYFMLSTPFQDFSVSKQYHAWYCRFLTHVSLSAIIIHNQPTLQAFSVRFILFLIDKVINVIPRRERNLLWRSSAFQQCYARVTHSRLKEQHLRAKYDLETLVLWNR